MNDAIRLFASSPHVVALPKSLGFSDHPWPCGSHEHFRDTRRAHHLCPICLFVSPRHQP